MPNPTQSPESQTFEVGTTAQSRNNFTELFDARTKANTSAQDYQAQTEKLVQNKLLPEYTVEEGDSLWGIVDHALAQKTGEDPPAWKVLETLKAIAEKNKLDNPDLIHPGDLIDLSSIDDGETSAQRQQNTEGQGQAVPAEQARRERQNTQSTGDGDGEGAAPNVPMSAGANKHSPRDKWYISQQGDGASWYACGPTSLTMALADFGIAPANEENRKRLISETGTNPSIGFPGTVSTMAAVARSHGLNAESSTSTNWQDVDAQLAQGHGVIINGALQGRAGLVPHFVYIAGKDHSGNYILGDPANPGTQSWTRSDLTGFMTRGAGSVNPPGFAAVWSSDTG